MGARLPGVSTSCRDGEERESHKTRENKGKEVLMELGLRFQIQV